MEEMKCRSSRSLPVTFRGPHPPPYTPRGEQEPRLGWIKRIKRWLTKTIISPPPQLPPRNRPQSMPLISFRHSTPTEPSKATVDRRRRFTSTFIPSAAAPATLPGCPLCAHRLPPLQEEDFTQRWAHLPPPPPIPSALKCEASVFTYGLKQLASCGWYWGPLSREEAKKKLENLPDGSFLVRDSSDDNQLLSVYLRSAGKTLYLRVVYSRGQYSFSSSPSLAIQRYGSAVELIEESVKASLKGPIFYSLPQQFTLDDNVTVVHRLSYPIRLTIPVSRFNRVRSLNFLCRFVIRLNTRIDLIPQLPLPKPILNYVQDGFF